MTIKDETEAFDYSAPPALFMPKRKHGSRRPLGYRRFATIARNRFDRCDKLRPPFDCLLSLRIPTFCAPYAQPAPALEVAIGALFRGT
jgi:hypothetical protein